MVGGAFRVGRRMPTSVDVASTPHAVGVILVATCWFPGARERVDDEITGTYHALENVVMDGDGLLVRVITL